MTLTELMIAAAILSICVLGMVGAFGGIQKAVQISKNKTLAANLAQEQMQILTQQNYYQVLTTPNPSFVAGVTPTIPYDTTYFPPQTILQGGITYTWYTYIQVAMQNNGAIVVMPPSTPDTGMRLITITVTWQQGTETKQAVVNSLLSNPNTVMTNSQLNGTVTDATTGADISGGLVNIAENMGWRDTTKTSGAYLINVTPGSYILTVSAAGYFSQYTTVSIAQNQTVTTNFQLVAMASGTVSGTAWVNDHLIVSQVVQDTQTYCLDGSGSISLQDVEYVELFNPTPNAVTLGYTGANWYTPKNPSLWLDMTSGGGSMSSNYAGEYASAGAYALDLVYVNTVIPAYSYFLYANTPGFYLNGVWVTADAYYHPGTGMAVGGAAGTTPPDIPHFLSAIPSNAGYAGLVNYYPSAGSNFVPIDAVRWDSTGSGPNGGPVWLGVVSTESIPVGITTSLGNPKGNQLVRVSSPTVTAAAMNTYGRAYNSQQSQLDYLYPARGVSGIQYMPHNVSSGTFTVIAGQPAVGAVVSSNDLLSNTTAAYSVGTPPVANFSLVGVATGTWTVLITSGGYTLENDTVTMPSQGSVYTFPSSTTILNQATTQGFIAGTVTDILGNPITSPSAITVSGGGASSVANSSNGRYILRVATGSVDVTANPGSANDNYVAVSSLAITVLVGQVHDGVNFQLSQGGQISGFVTRDGINALPGVAVSAIDSNGFARDTEITGNTGYFTTIVMATGTYAVTPELNSLELSSPTYQSTTIGSGQIVFSTTFTVTGAEGTITGTATAGGKAISTGVLIVVTTSTLTGTPPAPPSISSTTLTVNSYYTGSSLEDGTFSIPVMQSTSTTYNLYGYYSTVSSTGGVTTQSLKLTGISVLAGQTVSGQNLSW